MPGADNPSHGVGEVAVAGGRFVYARTDRAQITWRLAEGTVHQIVRWQPEQAYLAEEHLQPLEERIRGRLRVANLEAPVERVEEMVREYMAEQAADVGNPLRFFRSPFGDDSGRIWLPSYTPFGPREGDPPYIVVSAEGEWLGTVEGPEGLRILDVAAGRVLAVVADDVGVETVVVYRLE